MLNCLERSWEKGYCRARVTVKSDGFLLPPPSLTTFSVTINIPCHGLTGGKDGEDGLFPIGLM